MALRHMYVQKLRDACLPRSRTLSRWRTFERANSPLFLLFGLNTPRNSTLRVYYMSLLPYLRLCGAHVYKPQTTSSVSGLKFAHIADIRMRGRNFWLFIASSNFFRNITENIYRIKTPIHTFSLSLCVCTPNKKKII